MGDEHATGYANAYAHGNARAEPHTYRYAD
jgi:hypothetical protein